MPQANWIVSTAKNRAAASKTVAAWACCWQRQQTCVKACRDKKRKASQNQHCALTVFNAQKKAPAIRG